MRATLLGWLVVLTVAVGCGGSTGPNQNIAGTYAFTWRTTPDHNCCYADFMQEAVGTMAVTDVTDNSATTTFGGTYFDPTPQTAGWTGTDWQIIMNLSGQDELGTFRSYVVIVHWTPGSSCSGQFGADINAQHFGSCTVTRQ